MRATLRILLCTLLIALEAIVSANPSRAAAVCMHLDDSRCDETPSVLQRCHSDSVAVAAEADSKTMSALDCVDLSLASASLHAAAPGDGSVLIGVAHLPVQLPAILVAAPCALPDVASRARHVTPDVSSGGRLQLDPVILIV